MLKVWDKSGRNIKLDQAKYIDMSSLNKGFAFDIVAWGIRRSSNSEQIGNAQLPWFNAEEGIQMLRKIEMLEQTCHLRPTHTGRVKKTQHLSLLREINLWRDPQHS